MPTTPNPTQQLDFDRFSSDELLECFTAEAHIIRARSDRPVTTNFMGAFKPLDYWKWAAEVDFVSDDAYPDPADPASPMLAAFAHDVARSVGGGRPWVLMEQATAAVNWRERNVPKPPGANRTGTLRAIARGADSVLYFQWRQSVAGSEKFHSAMLPHSGARSRIFNEVRELGAEVSGFGHLAGTREHAQVALVLDWESWWALEQQASPIESDYLQGLTNWYTPLFEKNVPVDFVRPDADLSPYRLVIASRLFMLTEAAATQLTRYVEQGGHLAVTNRTGIVDHNVHLMAGGYLGSLTDVLGVRVEEFWPLATATTRVALGNNELLGELAAQYWTECVDVRDAEVIARIDEGFLVGKAAITRRRSTTGGGTAWYLSVDLDSRGYARLIDCVLDEAGVTRLPGVPSGVELIKLGDTLLALNKTEQTQDFFLANSRVRLNAYGSDLIQDGPTT